MAKAIAPKEIPVLPEGTTGWARSLRQGSMFHAHVLGHTACGKLRLDRRNSEPSESLGHLQYWGVCPSCYRKSQDTCAGLAA